jgi:hypothetical protein
VRVRDYAASCPLSPPVVYRTQYDNRFTPTLTYSFPENPPGSTRNLLYPNHQPECLYSSIFRPSFWQKSFTSYHFPSFRFSRAHVELYRHTSIPRIYHTIDWLWEDDKPCLPYHLLLRTLLTDSSLAGRVKKIKLRGGGVVRQELWQSGSCEDSYNKWHRAGRKIQRLWKGAATLRSYYRANELWKAMNVISAIVPPQTEERFSDFNKGSMDVIVGLILHQC